MATQQSFTGRSRRKQTPWTVRAADVIAQRLITFGGIGTIIAVSLVFVSLFFVVAPLFYDASLGTETRPQLPWSADKPLRVVIDEYQTMGWALYPDGRLQVFRLDNGETIETRQLLDGAATLTCLSHSLAASDLALGFSDGSVRFGDIAFESSFHEQQDVPRELRDLPVGGVGRWGEGVVQRTAAGQLRLQKVTATLLEPLAVAAGPVRALDHIAPPPETLGEQAYVFAYYADGGQAQFCRATLQENLLGQASFELAAFDLPLADPDRPEPPFRALLAGRGDNVYLIWQRGRLERYDVRDPEQIGLTEEADLLPESTAELTVCDFVLGRETLVCGDSAGGLVGWFRVRSPDDGYRMTPVHRLAGGPAAVTAFSASQRSRMIAVGYRDGRVRVYHVTTELLLVERQVAEDAAIETVLMAPKDNGLIAMTGRQVWRAEFDPRHPEATLASLFLPVWYEGYNRPIHKWESSYATSAPEAKFGMRNLVLGTLKATFYTMLFGAPLALLAAIYTSEFMDPRVRAGIKPTIEMMASLPSVVLGFLAALVFAPIVENVVPATLAAIVMVPLAYLIGANLWNLLPQKTMLWLQQFRLAFLVVPLVIAVPAAVAIGPLVEKTLFAGDIKRWLDGQIGSGTGAWMLLWLPLCGLLAAAVSVAVFNPWLRSHAERLTRGQFALLSLARFFLTVALALAAALAVSWLLNAAGWDPRGTYVDTYVQRNALVVGFVMGFAVIPIIYTIADDALSTVPNHLRSASLGCGATPWQTAIRVVVPTAMSGLFSALMIGLGRAVGETMIVLMAGGNTAVADWNIFNGFLTLSANIAVELPDAVPNSTHYRTLFLAALTLFILTFFVNTIAEVIRLRFRRRAYQL